MSQTYRLSSGGRVDRSKVLNFSFNGKSYQGYAGDTLASALLASYLVALLPARIALTHPGLQTQPPPLAVPGFDMLLLWPERLHRDPAHAWLRERIVSSLTG